jgi:hypothetical protein
VNKREDGESQDALVFLDYASKGTPCLGALIRTFCAQLNFSAALPLHAYKNGLINSLGGMKLHLTSSPPKKDLASQVIGCPKNGALA